jgi:hypothetical protein
VKFFLALILLAVAPAPIRAPKFCTPNSKNAATYCGKNPGGHPCLFYHPKEEFCEDENAPLPSCCRAADESGFVGCACCRSVYGSKKDISVKERGRYEHTQTETEYDIQ